MANFNSKNICKTYQSILNIGDANANLGSSQVAVTDSAGNASSIRLGISGQGLCVLGPITGSHAIEAGDCLCAGGTLQAGGATLGATAVGGTLTTTGNVNVNSSKFTVTATNGNTSAAGDLTVSGGATIGAASTVGGNLAVAGCITATADIIAYSSSDKRFKDDLNKICNTKNIINGLTGYSFKWNEASGREGNDLGIIAQDVKEVLPEIVQEREDGYLAVDYPKLIPVLIEEVKRLSDEVEKLKSIQTF